MSVVRKSINLFVETAMLDHITTIDSVLDFWFNELTPNQYFAIDLSIDNLISERFSAIHKAAIQGELYIWRRSAEGRLAEIIVLDQFSRNIYRGKKEAFASDGMALILAQEAIERGIAKALSAQQRVFLYLPFMHSESLAIHEQAVRLFGDPELKENLAYELQHKNIIEKFGRYPHRNAILGRASTAEEIAFLKLPNSSF